MRHGLTFLLAILTTLGASRSASALSGVGMATATVETAPVHTGGDAADDPAVWIHPQDASLSLIIGTDKNDGIAVYDLSGRELQYIRTPRPNNVDVRYGFPLGGERVSVAAFSRKDGSMGVYRIDPVRRQLVDAAARPLQPMAQGYGFCLYQSRVNDKLYAFLGDKRGAVEQWQLFDDGAGKVDGVRVRSLSFGSQTEGCVADDAQGVLYVGEEDVGIWRLAAEPDKPEARARVDTTGPGGHLRADVEGLAIYAAAGGTGYLIASSQGDHRFVVYDRQVPNGYRATFAIGDGRAIDGVSDTDGIDVTGFPLGAAFPEGLFVAQDGRNPGGNQNFKLVPWGVIARSVTPRLSIDTAADPRSGEPTAHARDARGGAHPSEPE